MWNKILAHVLSQIVRHGRLRVTLPDGTALAYGDGAQGYPDVSVRINAPGVVRRLVLNPELALGETYVEGGLTIDDDDLYGLLELAIRNMHAGNNSSVIRFNQVLRNGFRALKQFNPAARSQRNVAHHYDLSGELYDLFLDQDRQYSCAYFRSPDDTLEQAQVNKKAHIAGKLRLKPGMRVLDIGCGWGGMALTLARDHGAEVLGITLSREQHSHATARAERAGLSDRVRFELMDYRKLGGQFDRIVSVGMFEHVGVPHYRDYFRVVRERLTPDGVALIHTIGRAEPPGSTNPWIDRYIVPGGYVPAMSEVLGAIERERLWTTDVEVWRLHYAETLRHWHERFRASEARAEALYDAGFCRMWRYYLIACELTFRFNTQCVFQFQLTRDQQAVPLTRDYLYRTEDNAMLRSHQAAE